MLARRVSAFRMRAVGVSAGGVRLMRGRRRSRHRLLLSRNLGRLLLMDLGGLGVRRLLSLMRLYSGLGVRLLLRAGVGLGLLATGVGYGRGLVLSFGLTRRVRSGLLRPALRHRLFASC